MPSLPALSTNSELVGAAPTMVNGTVAIVVFSMENLFRPPDAESLAVNCQSLLGKPTPVLVSSNLIRVLFSFSLIVSKPKASPSTQSSPTQALPCTMRSSGITKSAIALPLVMNVAPSMRAMTRVLANALCLIMMASLISDA